MPKFFPRKIIKVKYFIIGFFLFLVGTAFLALKFNKDKAVCSKCNVILVSIDTLSALHLPCYGYERNTAPNLCAFADKNITFLNSYSQSPITLNSHFSIITSLYPHTHKMTSVLSGMLDEKYLTLAQVLRASGYKTIFHGPLNDFHLPLDRGFERGFNTIEPDTDIETWKNAYPKLLRNVIDKNSTFIFFHTYAVHYPYLTGHEVRHLFTDQPEDSRIALTEEEYHVESLEFFSFVATNLVQKFREQSAGNKIYNLYEIAKELKSSNDLEASKKIFNKVPYTYQNYMRDLWYARNFNVNDKNNMEYLKSLYDERIHQMDQELKRLLDLVNGPKMSDNTILIITADHGEEFGEHGNWGHASDLYDTQTRVPLIIHIPGIKPKKINEIVQGIDIYPTVLGLIGIMPKSRLEGIDLTGLITGKPNSSVNRYVLGEYINQSTIRDKRYLLYSRQNPPSIEFYDTVKDKEEQNNASVMNFDKIQNYLSRLNKLTKKVGYDKEGE